MQAKSVRDVTPPPDIPDWERAEFDVLADALSRLEDTWLALHAAQEDGGDEYSQVFDREFGARIAQAEVIEDVDLDGIEKEYMEQCDTIDREFESDRKNLFKRIVRGYQTSYQTVMGQIRSAMGSDFEKFQSEHELDFPQIPLDKSQERKPPQPEEPRLAFSPHETDRQLKTIKHEVQRAPTPGSDNSREQSD